MNHDFFIYGTGAVMHRKNLILLLMVSVVSTLVFSALVSAQEKRFLFSRSKAEDKTPELTEKAGPWLIMVMSFAGEDGEQQAARLANELRTKHKLKTYTYTHSFNIDASEHAMGYEVVELSDDQKTIVPKTMTTSSPNRFDETAVLVGDFASVDDPQAQRTLEKIKFLKPEALPEVDFESDVLDDDLAGGRLYARRMWLVKDSKWGPLSTAFMLANPLLPDEFFQSRKTDKLVLELNSGLKYSLFDCPGQYSVKVATFSGATIYDQNEIAKIKAEEDRKRRKGEGITESKLANAAKRATLLTHELRRQGFEAYEFHDRYESYVCVGSFDYLTTEERGSKRNHPGIEETILKFKSSSIQRGNGMIQSQSEVPLPPKFLEAGIVCDVQPLPVLVPKKDEVRAANRFLDRFR
jgi:hypothetical protein